MEELTSTGGVYLLVDHLAFLFQILKWITSSWCQFSSSPSRRCWQRQTTARMRTNQGRHCNWPGDWWRTSLHIAASKRWQDKTNYSEIQRPITFTGNTFSVFIETLSERHASRNISKSIAHLLRLSTLAIHARGFGFRIAGRHCRSKEKLRCSYFCWRRSSISQALLTVVVVWPETCRWCLWWTPPYFLLSHLRSSLTIAVVSSNRPQISLSYLNYLTSLETRFLMFRIVYRKSVEELVDVFQKGDAVFPY